MQTVHFDIRNGDVAIYYGKNGEFLGADLIKCGEWSSFSADEKDDFLCLMDHWGNNVSKESKNV